MNADGSYFVPLPDGSLEIYEMPVERELYSIGVDTSEGVKDGDWSVAEVIRMRDCAQVASWRCLEVPHYWGRKVCLLAAAYNNALLGIETGASAHGMTAANYARDFGYPNLYLRTTYDGIGTKMTDKLGFRTDRKTKPLLVDRVRLAISEDTEIHEEGLLRECMAMKLEEGGPSGYKIVSEDHDDRVIAYGIALMIRDEQFHTGLPGVQQERKRLDRSEQHWKEWHDQVAAHERARRRPRMRTNRRAVQQMNRMGGTR